MKRNIPNIKLNLKEMEEKKRLANEINNLLPHVTDEVHMKAALALNCDYQVIKAYLAGNIEDESVARELIRNLQVIIERGYDSFGDNVDAQDAGLRFCHVAESVLNTFKLCNANNIMLSQIETWINNNHLKLQDALNEINQKCDLVIAATKR